MGKAKRLAQWTVGVGCLLVATLIWAGASVLAQYIYRDLDFHSPFMMTWIANSLFIIYLPLWQLWVALGIVKKDRNPAMGSFSMLLRSPGTAINPLVPVTQLDKDSNSDFNALPSSSRHSHASSVNDEGEGEGEGEGGGGGEGGGSRRPSSASRDGDWGASPGAPIKYTHMHALRAALIIAPLYFLANCLYNYSLYMTSVSSSTIISNLAASFTLFFSWYAGLEEITWPKVAGLVLCFVGALAVGLNDAENAASGGGGATLAQELSSGSVGGDFVALLAAVGYGAYTTLIRLQLPDEESVSMQLVLGYIGTVIFALLLPVVLGLLLFSGDGSGSGSGGGEFAGVRHMSLAALGFIILGGLCDNVFSDYLWARAVVLTSPTVATVGMSITIPFAMLSDFLLGNNTNGTPVLSLVGAALVVLGFTLVNFEPETLYALAARWGCSWLCCGVVGVGGGSGGGVGGGEGAGRYAQYFDSVHGGAASRENFVQHIRSAYSGSASGSGYGPSSSSALSPLRLKRSHSDDGDTDSETGLVGGSSGHGHSQHGEGEGEGKGGGGGGRA